MCSFSRMFAAGIAGALVGLLGLGAVGALVLASALSQMSDSCRDGGCGSTASETAVAPLAVCVVGVTLCACTLRLVLGSAARGRWLLLGVAGGVLVLGTGLTLAGSVFVGHAITGGAGALWLPLGLAGTALYVRAWAKAMTGYTARFSR